MGITVEQRLGQPQAQWGGDIAQALYDARVCMPGIVQAFDPATQTVSVQLAIREKVVQSGKVQEMEFPPLLLVPLVLPRAGGMCLTMPVKAGDECLVIFADMCMDGWWQSGGVQGQLDKRRHDFWDGFAVLGTWSQPRLIPRYSTSSAQLRTDDGAVVVDVATAGVTVTAPHVNVVSPDVSMHASGGTPSPLLVQGFLTWFETVYMPSVQYKATQPVPPSTGLLTTVVQGQ